MSESPQHALGKRLRKPSVKIAASDSELTATDEDSLPWTKQQASLFLSSFHQHGDDFGKISKLVGGGKTGSRCEALFRKHQGYLSIPRVHHSEVAWWAMVQDSMAEMGHSKARAEVTSSEGGDRKATAAASPGTAVTAPSGGASSVAISKGRRTPRSPWASSHQSSFQGGGSSPRSPGGVTRGNRQHSAAAQANDTIGNTSAWGQSSRRSPAARGDAVPSPAKRRRLSANLFPEEQSPLPVRQSQRVAGRSMEEEKSGIDALLSLAAAPSDSGLMANLDVDNVYDSDEEGEEPAPQSQCRSDSSPEVRPRSTSHRAASKRVKRLTQRVRAAETDASGAFWPVSPSYQSSVQHTRHARKSAATSSQAIYSTGPRKRRKPPPERKLPLPAQLIQALGADSSVSDAGAKSPASKTTADRLLSSAAARRWVAAEFMYPALDRPFFLRHELQEFLVHAGISCRLRLTRREWSAIRSALGQPRRLSLTFLHQERAKLEAYRNIVRAKYLQVGDGKDPPPEMPRPLAVGQRVTARHPLTRQPHDGDILTVAPSCYRVQFDMRELGVELVKDIHVMPADPLQALPAALLACTPVMLLNGHLAVDGIPNPQAGTIAKAGDPPEGDTLPQMGPAAGRATQAARAAAAVNAPAAIQAISQGMSALDQKEALLVQIRSMNDEAASGMHSQNGAWETQFKRAYAVLLVRLQHVNTALESHLTQLQQSTPALTSPTAAVNANTGSGGLDSPVAQTPATPRRDVPPVPGWQDTWSAAQSLVALLTPPPSCPPLSPQDQSSAVKSTEDCRRRMIPGSIALMQVVRRCSGQSMLDRSVLQLVKQATAALRPRHTENTIAYETLQASVDQLVSKMCTA